jgi:hypothetical protein
MSTNIDAVLATIRQMESGGNYTVVTRGGSDACGAYQYITSTWQSMLHRTINAGWLPKNTPMYSRACQAPPNVQDAVARYDVTSFLGSVGDNVSLVPLHWYYPAAISSWPAMANYTPPGNSISLGAYQNKWMSVYQSKAGAGSGGGNLPNNQGSNPVNNNTGVRYSYAQLEQVWINAGGNPQVAPVAAAVAMAESGGNPSAISPSNDYGLWQINSIHGAQATLDVMANARAAVAISHNGADWGPWCTCWVNPGSNCGHHLGPNPQPGSPASRYINPNVKPDPSAPTNGTAAATADPAAQQAEQMSFLGLGSGPCNTVEWFIQPGLCGAAAGAGNAAGAAGGIVQHAGSDLASGVIDMVMASILNPIISLVAGGFGMLAGGFLMLIAIWIMVKDTRPVQAVKRGAVTAAELGTTAAIAPEALPEVAVARHGAQRREKTRQVIQRDLRQQRKQSKRSAQQQRRGAIKTQARRYETAKTNGASTNGASSNGAG